MPAQYLRRINASWYFCARVPEDVKNHLKMQEIQKALHTKSLADARILMRDCLGKVNKLFMFIRSGVLSPDQAQEMLLQQSLKAGASSRRKEDNLRPTPRVLYPAFVSEKMNTGEWKEKTRQETQTCINLFLDIAVIKPVAGYSHADMLYQLFHLC